MKKLIMICMLTGIMVIFSGCLMVSLDNFPGNAVQGTGPVISRDFTVLDFTGINIDGAYVVVYRHSDTSSVTIQMQENLFDYLNVGVRNDILHIDSNRSFRTARYYTPRIYIYAPYLSLARFGGAASMEDWDEISVDRLSIGVSGAASGKLIVDVNNLSIEAAGAVDFDVYGTASSASISISGAGEIYAANLQTENATVNVTGAGTVDIAVSDTLDITIAGTGTVRYIGNPYVSRSIAGMGSVRQRD